MSLSKPFRPAVWVVALLATIGVASRGAAAPQDGRPARVLLIEYADGRTTSQRLARESDMWTPLFPRVPGVKTDRENLPLNALGVQATAEGDVVTVVISLQYGTLHDERVTVATRRLASADVARVEELEAYGVQPIRLSIGNIPVTVTYPPVVQSVSSSIDLRVEPLGETVPGYRVSIANRSSRVLISIGWASFRGETKMYTGRRRNDRNLPLLASGGQEEFDIPMGSVVTRDSAPPSEWLPADRVAIFAVLWEDGVFQGNPADGAKERRVYEGRRQELAEILALLREDAPPSSTFRQALTTRRANLRAGSVEDIAEFNSVLDQIGRKQVLEAVMADLDAFDKRSDDTPVSYRTWLDGRIVDYDQWLQRITTQLQHPPLP